MLEISCILPEMLVFHSLPSLSSFCHCLNSFMASFRPPSRAENTFNSLEMDWGKPPLHPCRYHFNGLPPVLLLLPHILQQLPQWQDPEWQSIWFLIVLWINKGMGTIEPCLAKWVVKLIQECHRRDMPLADLRIHLVCVLGWIVSAEPHLHLEGIQWRRLAHQFVFDKFNNWEVWVRKHGLHFSRYSEEAGPFINDRKRYILVFPSTHDPFCGIEWLVWTVKLICQHHGVLLTCCLRKENNFHFQISGQTPYLVQHGCNLCSNA